MDSKQPAFTFNHPAHLQGQIDTLRQMMLAFAGLAADPHEWRAQCLQHIEHLRTGALPSEMPEPYFAGIDEMERWLLQVTPE